MKRLIIFSAILFFGLSFTSPYLQLARGQEKQGTPEKNYVPPLFAISLNQVHRKK